MVLEILAFGEVCVEERFTVGLQGLIIQNVLESVDSNTRSRFRRTVGPLEVSSILSPEPDVQEWRVNGNVVHPAIRNELEYIAPIAPATELIEAELTDGTICTLEVKTIAQKESLYRKNGADTNNEFTAQYVAGNAGAGMVMRVTARPSYVNLSNIEVAEDVAPNVSNNPGSLAGAPHDRAGGALSWQSVDDATHSSGKDRAALFLPPGRPGPWIPGEAIWHIPEIYRDPANPGATFPFNGDPIIQRVALDAMGTVHVEKAIDQNAGNTITRSP